VSVFPLTLRIPQPIFTASLFPRLKFRGGIKAPLQTTPDKASKSASEANIGSSLRQILNVTQSGLSRWRVGGAEQSRLKRAAHWRDRPPYHVQAQPLHVTREEAFNIYLPGSGLDLETAENPSKLLLGCL
jgi:hypothetical protein